MPGVTAWYWLVFVSITLCRSRLRGCAGVKTASFSGSSRTSSWPCSSRTRWSSGPCGSMVWSPRSWSPTSKALLSLKLPNSSYLSGPSTGTTGGRPETAKLSCVDVTLWIWAKSFKNLVKQTYYLLFQSPNYFHCGYVTCSAYALFK